MRGGTRGILTAIDAGRVDPEDARTPEDEFDPAKLSSSGSERRARAKRDKRIVRAAKKRAKAAAERSPF